MYKLFLTVAFFIFSLTGYCDSATYGTYQKNNAKVTIKDYVFHWKKSTKRLTIIQTPSLLTDSERSRLKAGESDFMVLFNKESPDKAIWQWYPYIVTQLTFKSEEINSKNIKRLYLKAYGIEEKNFTDNINASPDKNHIFNKIELNDEKLSIKYSGNTDIMKDNHIWSINF